MDEDLDVEAMLEAPFVKESDERRSFSPDIKKIKRLERERSRSFDLDDFPRPPKDYEFRKTKRSSRKEYSRSPPDYDRSPLDQRKSPPEHHRSPSERHRSPPDYRRSPPSDHRRSPPDFRRSPPDHRRSPPPDYRRSPPVHRRSPPPDYRRSPPDPHYRSRREPYDRRERRYSRSPDRRWPSRRGGYNPRYDRRRYGGGFRGPPRRHSDREYYHRRSRSRSFERRPPPPPRKSRSRSPSPKRFPKRPDFIDDKPKNLGRNPDLTPEERDMRTVFCMQLSQRVRARDLEEFFSPVGKVQDVRIILDNKTKRSKGIAYIEFEDTYSVTLAMGYSGKKLLGVPIVVQLTQAEKNRAAMSSMMSSIQHNMVGPMRLYVGSLHFNITEDMLKGIFEPFGKIDRIELLKDTETGKSKGYGFVTFHDCESAKKALEQLNGFELAGRPMKVGTVNDRNDLVQGPAFLDTEEMDRAGIDLGATGRLQLMAKLAEGTGFELPQAAVKALQLQASQAAASPMPNNPAVNVATQCFMLSNMFDTAKETAPNWDEDIRNDVIDECKNHGGALHVYVDKNSAEGNVYVKCPNMTTAAASVTALHGRYFAGRIIVAAYVPVANYHMLFPDSANASTTL